MSGRKNIVVLGAGVVGLTTALLIQEKGGYDVTIIAETFPSDPKTIKYCSQWAGGHHVSFANGDPKMQKIDSDTFKVMWELSAPGGDAEGCFLRIHETEFFYDGRDAHLDWMPDFKVLSQDALVPEAKTGISFTTLTFDGPKYLNYLLSRFLAHGGSIVRASIQHINQLIEGGVDIFRGRLTPSPVDALVLCPGLGARTLGGVEDQEMYPVRGQVVLLRAPWVKFGRTASHTEEGVWTYIIPRRSGEIVCGGTKLEGDWYPAPRPETTEDILQRCLALCPELAPPEVRAQRAPTVDDLRALIIEVGVGLRPARKSGLRLETVWVSASIDGRKLPAVLNYGHSGSGFQSSWGSAIIALDLLEEALRSS
ncbi:D-amino-acid oxidase [Laetiporus sulphureus 93-53]|uniref:D-amino-acid oxidase n=1 Tax=Laetiporus sulphureus 93-53 TaxID=1314785 RepID=A0A165EZE1_9APHY|nr:D-amino-acid oxidase [Laetiporus sulphureus 93-53]KZT08038.1 D-amino-acid oxidase [Laetiporus sulphureus 93-53]